MSRIKSTDPKNRRCQTCDHWICVNHHNGVGICKHKMTTVYNRYSCDWYRTKEKDGDRNGS